MWKRRYSFLKSFLNKPGSPQFARVYSAMLFYLLLGNLYWPDKFYKNTRSMPVSSIMSSQFRPHLCVLLVFHAIRMIWSAFGAQGTPFLSRLIIFASKNFWSASSITSHPQMNTQKIEQISAEDPGSTCFSNVSLIILQHFCTIEDCRGNNSTRR